MDGELAALYLEGTDNGKLDVADTVQDSDLEQLLVSLVEVKIDVENIVLYFEESLKKDKEYSVISGPRSVDGETAARIRDMRKRLPDETLREQYLTALEADSGLSWEEFILQRAKDEES
jgi:hypothetical protein